MRFAITVAVIAALAGCSSPRNQDEAKADNAPGKVTIDRSDETMFVTFEAAEIVSGRRPEMTLFCEAGRPTSFLLKTVVNPSHPTPLAGTFGSFSFDGNSPRSVELSWNTGDNWTGRDKGDASSSATIASTFLGANSVSFEPPPGYGLKSISWRVAALPVEAKAACLSA